MRIPRTTVTGIGLAFAAAGISDGTLPGKPRLAGLVLLALGAVAMAGVTIRGRSSERVPADG